MTKNVIVFSDGTSNTKRTNTNVYQFYKALKDHPKTPAFMTQVLAPLVAMS